MNYHILEFSGLSLLKKITNMNRTYINLHKYRSQYTNEYINKNIHFLLMSQHLIKYNDNIVPQVKFHKYVIHDKNKMLNIERWNEYMCFQSWLLYDTLNKKIYNKDTINIQHKNIESMYSMIKYKDFSYNDSLFYNVNLNIHNNELKTNYLDIINTDMPQKEPQINLEWRIYNDNKENIGSINQIMKLKNNNMKVMEK